MKTEFSIVIPVYNAAETLPETLQSVSEQSFRDFEVILVNDGSTDNSGEILATWKSELDYQVTIVEQDNKGLGAARNAGIAKAMKKWIALFDADDIWEPQKLETLAKAISEKEADLYYHQVKVFGLDISKTRSAYAVRSIADLLSKGNPIVPSATIISKDILRKFPFSENRDYHGAEDLHLWLRLLAADKKFCFLKAPLTQYRETEGMSTRIEEHLHIVFKVLEDLYQKGLFSQKELAVAKRRKYLEVARFYHKRKKFEVAQKFYAAADFKSVKIFGLRSLALLGIKI